MLCPHCWRDTKIYRTKADEQSNTVTRYHICLDKKCKYRFKTKERVTGAVKPWAKKSI